MDLEGWVWLLFFVVVGLLRLVGWLLRVLGGPAQQPGVPPPGRPEQRGETPFQKLLRQLEQAARDHEQEGEPPVRPRPRPRPEPVLRARPVPQAPQQQPSPAAPSRRPLEPGLAEHHLQAEVAQHHLETQIAERKLDGQVERRGPRPPRPPRMGTRHTFWRQLAQRSELQRAVLLSEVLGPPRALAPRHPRRRG